MTTFGPIGEDEPLEPQSPETEDSEDTRPTRTELTRAATEVNRLGMKLAALPPADLARLDLPERIREEIEISRSLKPKSRGRQNRLIGQLLRAEDHETIRADLEDLDRVHRLDVQQEKQNERWLERLLKEADAGVEALIEAYPSADRQWFRGQTRTARKDPASRPGKRARRELLRGIRTLRKPADAD